MSIEFDGLDDVMKMLDKPFNQATLNLALMRACLVVEGAARINAQSFAKTGELAGSIASKIEEGQGIVYTPLEYAPYVEYGTGLFAEEGGRTDVPWSYQDDEGEWHTTSGRPPHPFMRPALDQNKEKVKKVFLEGMLND